MQGTASPSQELSILLKQNLSSRVWKASRKEEMGNGVDRAKLHKERNLLEKKNGPLAHSPREGFS